MPMMEWITIIGVGIALAMDAFAVSIVSGSIFRQLHIRHILRMAFFFGAFQALMPLVGFAAGQTFADYISHVDHWVAFVLLAAIGGKMVYESFKISQVEKRPPDPSNLLVVLVLSFATSIDALVVGITLSLMTEAIYLAVAVIGVITFALSYAGIELGRKAGHFFENKIELIGGLILIAIGLKILFKHL